MRFLPFFLILTLFTACQQKDKAPSLIGKWEYEKMERYDGQIINLEDSMLNQLHQSQKGLTFSFSANNMFKVTQLKTGNNEEMMAEQKYELPADKKMVILKNTGRPDDKFSIIELSDDVLKINIFYSEVAYMVFRKRK